MTVLNVQMKGNALFFKTISVQQKILRSGFRRVSDDLALAQAADILGGPPLVRLPSVALLSRSNYVRGPHHRTYLSSATNQVTEVA
jgi:hypothetical protein